MSKNFLSFPALCLSVPSRSSLCVAIFFTNLSLEIIGQVGQNLDLVPEELEAMQCSSTLSS